MTTKMRARDGAIIGLGCMRLSTDHDRDDERAAATLAAAFDAGISLFDTAHAYAQNETELGHNERLLARAWKAHHAPPTARIITKCGMRRDAGKWIVDGRARRILEDAEASARAFDGVPVDVLLLHAPDPKVPLATSIRALARAHEQGLARSIGVSNVTRRQLDECLRHAPITAVEVPLGAYDDVVVRGGVVARCHEKALEVFAHAPLGGPERAARLARDATLAAIAARHPGCTAGDVVLAYLCSLTPTVVPIVGARRPETSARIAKATSLILSEEDLASLDARFPAIGDLRTGGGRAETSAVAGGRDVEVAILMGVPGAGKSRAAAELVGLGYERLNRDAAGGSLRGIADRLAERLREGATRLVLDNTYVSRAARNDVIRAAKAHGARVRCVHLDVPLVEAQVNVVSRMLDRFGRVLGPDEIAKSSRVDTAAMAPNALARMMRALEPPQEDEGFTEIEIRPFVREHAAGGGRAIVMSLTALERAGYLPTTFRRVLENARLVTSRTHDPALLVFGWREAMGADALEELGATLNPIAGHPVDVAVCPHPEGPPICWCRPPLPGLFLEFARRRSVDLRSSILFGASASDRTVARTFGMTFAEIGVSA